MAESRELMQRRKTYPQLLCTARAAPKEDAFPGVGPSRCQLGIPSYRVYWNGLLRRKFLQQLPSLIVDNVTCTLADSHHVAERTSSTVAPDFVFTFYTPQVQK